MFLIKDVPVGRLNALVKKIGGLQVMDGILDGTLKLTVEKIVEPTPADLAVFFTTRPGLLVTDGFWQQILALALAMPETAPASVGEPYDLRKDMYDTEIRQKLGENHIFENARAFCRYLQRALSAQLGGTEGDLRTFGHENIFYVRGGDGAVFVVSVKWNANGRNWSISADHLLDADRWYHGTRAFPRN